jgi:esterase/lipase
MRKLGAREKKLVWTEGAGHVITVDYGRERVYSEVRAWLDAHTRGAAAAADSRAAT